MTQENSKIFFFITALIGICLMFLQIDLYRNTFISIKVLLFVTILSSSIGWFLINRHYKKTYSTAGFFFPMMQSLLSFGFASCYLFLALNFYFPAAAIKTDHYLRISKYTIGTKHNKPALKIDFNGSPKEFVFYSTQRHEVNQSTHIKLSVQEGFLGYDIFSKAELYP